MAGSCQRRGARHGETVALHALALRAVAYRCVDGHRDGAAQPRSAAPASAILPSKERTPAGELCAKCSRRESAATAISGFCSRS